MLWNASALFSSAAARARAGRAATGAAAAAPAERRPRDGFSAHPITGATEGRDTNALIREVFGVPERPQPQLDELCAIRTLIDDARARLDTLAASLSEIDDDVVALRMRMHVAEAAE